MVLAWLIGCFALVLLSADKPVGPRGRAADHKFPQQPVPRNWLNGLLKWERVRRRIYRSRDEARQDVFDYIEMFYNPKRKHVRNGMPSPVEFERQQNVSAEGV